jgi:hypothetical protein
VRAHLARRLVKVVSFITGRAYLAYTQDRKEDEIRWQKAAHALDGILLFIAGRLDREAMTEQMANEGWWG